MYVCWALVGTQRDRGQQFGESEEGLMEMVVCTSRVSLEGL